MMQMQQIENSESLAKNKGIGFSVENEFPFWPI